MNELATFLIDSPKRLVKIFLPPDVREYFYPASEDAGPFPHGCKGYAPNFLEKKASKPAAYKKKNINKIQFRAKHFFLEKT